MVAFYPHFVSCGEKATLLDVVGEYKHNLILIQFPVSVSFSYLFCIHFFHLLLHFIHSIHTTPNPPPKAPTIHLIISHVLIYLFNIILLFRWFALLYFIPDRPTVRSFLACCPVVRSVYTYTVRSGYLPVLTASH